MAEVFDYYHLGLTNAAAILSALRDKLIDYGWTIDYDGIDSGDRLTFHVTNTNCYFSLHLNDLINDGYRYFPFTLYGFLDNEITKWIPISSISFKNCDLFTRDLNFSSYLQETNPVGDFFIIDSFLLINNKICFIILYGYSSKCGITKPFSEIFGFGQLNIYNESLYGNLFFVSPFIRRLGSGGVYFYVNKSITLFFYYKDKVNNFHYDNFCIYCAKSWSYPCDSGVRAEEVNEFPQLTYQPVQFNRIYLRTLPLISSYSNIDGVNYRHVVGETPFYFCYYPGRKYFNRTIEYGSRKFKIYSNGWRAYEAHNFGIAFEVGNL